MKKTMERYGTKTAPRRALAIFLALALAFSFTGITGAGGMVATAEATDSSTAPGASKADEARPFESNAEDAESELGGGEDPKAPTVLPKAKILPQVRMGPLSASCRLPMRSSRTTRGFRPNPSTMRARATRLPCSRHSKRTILHR